MPRRPTTRGPLGRRSLPPSPTYDHAPAAPTGDIAASRRREAQSRPERLVEREAPYMLAELRRIAYVTATCIGMLVMLVIVDRMT